MAKKTINKELTGAQDLYNFLFEACNIIRGPVSQDNFKDYITPLLYYKRISDVYDEETEEALISSGGDKEYASLPEQHRFVIPDGCHWQEVRERTENLGAAIVGAMRQIEIANPDTLYGVLSMFSSQKWTNKAILNDSKIRDLIEHLSKRKLGNKDYPADLMGDAYEILLKKFADDSKAQAGEFYTPRSVVRLLVHILDPQPGETVYDPACGSGGMLIEAIRYMHDDSLCCGSIFGQEKNVVNAAIAKMNLFLHGASDFNVMQGDTLRDPKILQGGNIAKFDCVIANPPFSLENWGVECIFCLNENAYFDGVNYVCPDCGREWPCDEIADDDDDNNKLRCPECGSHLVYPDSSGINDYACDACGCRWDGDDDDYDEDYDDDDED